MMKVLRYDAPRQARMVDSAELQALGKVSVAQTLVTSVSAGTEMGFYRGTAPFLNARPDGNWLFEDCPNAITYPMQSDGPGVWFMGYSSVGRITQVGPEEKELKAGDLVWSSSGHRSMAASDGFMKLPADVNPEHASLISLIEIAFNGMLDARVKLLDTVVIFGMGTLGQLLVQMCKMSGAKVIAVDYLASRLELAGKLGADVLYDPNKQGDIGRYIQEQTRGRGADVVFEVTGNIKALPHAIRCVGRDGTVTVMSFYQGGADALELGREFHLKRIRLRSSQIGGVNPELWPRYDEGRRRAQVLELLKKLQIAPLITHKVSCEKLPETLAMIDQNPSACQAVVVRWGEGK